MTRTNVFDLKGFNENVFAKYVETIPNLRKNELIKSGVLRPRPELSAVFPDQVGGNFITLPITGRLENTPGKYDGSSDLWTDKIDTFMRGMIVTGLQQGWGETDFTQSITGHDFMEEIAAQVSDYWDEVDQKTILAILEGIFAMEDGDEQEFVEKHSLDIASKEDNMFSETTLNRAIQKAGGDNKNAYTTILMHSEVATNLENLNLMSRLKYTDSDGISRDLSLGTLNGRRVIIDDELPFDHNGFTSYVLGEGAFDYIDCGVRVPYELYRDPKKYGGMTELITRQRKIFSPAGISFTAAEMVSASPCFSELACGANWELARNAERSRIYPLKAIPIARIITKG
jgi:hypothetical protein